MAGIVGYGTSVPQCRIAIEEIFDMWPYSYPPDSIKALLGLIERAVNRVCLSYPSSMVFVALYVNLKR
jgi:3-hydroxy-3-methylglutaryl CoA synthase